MCGLAGAFDPGTPPGAWPERLSAMAAALAHRGPDDEGAWHDPAAGIGLAFRRLAIVDLSVEGHQPMHSASGRFVIAFNGEVFNFGELSRELSAAGARFRGHSDTEVMLAAIEAWGLEAAVNRFVGMFAIALWDRTERTLHLVRDRLGIKPLYWGWSGGALLFGSEMTALRRHPAFSAALDPGALASFLRFNYVPAPYAAFEGFRKLEPGCIRTFDLSGRPRDGEGRPRAYWSLAAVAREGLAHPFAGTETEAVDELERRLRESVALRMIADVPLGAFLSGGIDSSLVVALMRAQASGPVKTFTIGFAEKEYDESPWARDVARHLGTEHTEHVVTAPEALETVPRIAALFDEPFADSSQVPTLLVSALARRHVTVSLSGDGGDELFAGYKRYALFADLWRALGRLPGAARRALAAVLGAVPVGTANRLSAFADPLLRRYGSGGAGGDKLAKLAELLALPDGHAVYLDLLSHWKHPEMLIRGAAERPRLADGVAVPAGFPDPQHPLMFDDMLAYLPDDILVKVDRTSMSVGLEARVPLLDHRVVEYAWTLPLALKVRDGGTKWALRQVLYRHLPRALVDRPKMGFGLPIDQWLRGPLREWAEELISEQRLRREGLIDPAPVREKWEEHLSGRRNWHYYLWDVLVLQAWREAHGV
ncbi:MAG TPA: asparagine synthase (glutamine-hydrolyzing) [Candidatus Sulfotelmatobacter sp.]|nr:asparagine synthase (glutamine-hydrolyzing) [Candidatus Sulfotelmatobacter sp.]